MTNQPIEQDQVTDELLDAISRALAEKLNALVAALQP